ncbi:hypothetical protein JXA80_04815 [bacterium]|nr:hypothetical protein [candidate division CSSED10-310 bacterium]
MKRVYLWGLMVLLGGMPAGAVIQTIGISGMAGCEDGMDSVCYNHAPMAYIGFFDWFGMGMFFSYEGAKVCFDISSLSGCIASEMYLTYDGIGNPGGYAWAQGSGPVIVKSLDAGSCQPVCGTSFDPCSTCPDGVAYGTGTVSGGTGMSLPIATVVTDTAVIDLQAAIDNGDPCFCLCMTWDGSTSYEVAMSNLHLDIEVACSATPIPTETPVPSPSPTPSATLTPDATTTPAPIPSTGAAGLGVMLFVFGLLAGAMGMRKSR